MMIVKVDICRREHAVYGILVLLIMALTLTKAEGQSRAHESSKYAIIDPAYEVSTSSQASAEDKAGSWIYGASELESWRLEVLKRRKDTAGLNVNYPGVYHTPFAKGSFKLKLKSKLSKTVKFKAVGKGKVYADNRLIMEFDAQDGYHVLKLKKTVSWLQFDLETEEEPIGLLIEATEANTASIAWEWKHDSGTWEPAYHFPANESGIPPHLVENPSILLKPMSVQGNLFDFGKELYGYIIIKKEDKPVMNFGESDKEALDIDNTQLEQSLEIVEQSKGIWKTKSPVAFRYLYAEDVSLEDISCEAIFYPAAYKGAFACSDSTLTKIWMNSAYTLRICMHDFLLDGMKRDRLPWTGDLTMSMLVNAFTFGDPELARRTLVALGRAGIKEKDINGIIDYSVWWVIAQDNYQLYYDDSVHLTHEWGRIKEVMKDLSVRCNDNGFLTYTEDDWIFIDWVDQDKFTALQILWWWAQKSTANLAVRMGDDETASYWNSKSDELKDKLIKEFWDEEQLIWKSGIDSDTMNTRHPNFFAIVSGLSDENRDGIKALLEDENVKQVGTPYMAGFEMMALSKMGNTDYMLNRISDYWGGMLDRGATTFWEAYDPSETYENQYSFYGRPYAKSLCHAWSAGPAAILPSELFGLKPIEDGWKTFTINPNIGSLTWASASVPTQYGDIVIDIKEGAIRVEVPSNTTLMWEDQEYVGPQILNKEY